LAVIGGRHGLRVSGTFAGELVAFACGFAGGLAVEGFKTGVAVFE
jgi:hypothetical protein